MTHKRILCLLVEDFEDSRFMMRRLLECAGYRVVEATDGEEAVKVALKERPQLILMDLSLPKLDGLEATRRIRSDKASAGTPIIAVSAHDSPQTREGALAAGCNEYVTKPVDFDHLTSVVEQLLTRGASSAQN